MTHLTSLCLLVAAFTLVTSAVHHIVRWRRFTSEIAAQRVLPPKAAWLPAGAATLAEAALGGLLLLIAFGGETGNGLRRAAPLLAAALFAIYSGYTAALLRFRPDAPCGCGSAARPVSIWTVLRAVLLCGTSILATGSPGLPEMALAESVPVMVMAAIAAIAIWVVPEALHVPGWRGTTDKYAELR